MRRGLLRAATPADGLEHVFVQDGDRATTAVLFICAPSLFRAEAAARTVCENFLAQSSTHDGAKLLALAADLVPALGHLLVSDEDVPGRAQPGREPADGNDLPWQHPDSSQA
ncbi:hypothetical protein [Streptomyces sp. S.PNR 29]|uniref:hypothetical protein n=1 Tax=Streptomyces sp. S.PNR 29 TaxID=2973805 RepID=UPI0025AFFD7C|nr:hypothetical protein [Streptomyces sp. S.PNR 29]MDN0198679.1 hypothetical protein [Streptomyces sp. S.PNR 29]